MLILNLLRQPSPDCRTSEGRSHGRGATPTRSQSQRRERGTIGAFCSTELEANWTVEPKKTSRTPVTTETQRDNKAARDREELEEDEDAEVGRGSWKEDNESFCVHLVTSSALLACIDSAFPALPLPPLTALPTAENDWKGVDRMDLKSSWELKALMAAGDNRIA